MGVTTTWLPLEFTPLEFTPLECTPLGAIPFHAGFYYGTLGTR